VQESHQDRAGAVASIDHEGKAIYLIHSHLPWNVDLRKFRFNLNHFPELWAFRQQTNPDYGQQSINPISRLIQIQQAKKEKDPVYTLVAEKGMPRRREFIMQVRKQVHFWKKRSFFIFATSVSTFYTLAFSSLVALKSEGVSNLVRWSDLLPVLVCDMYPAIN
jgi:hypothetical protein